MTSILFIEEYDPKPAVFARPMAIIHESELESMRRGNSRNLLRIAEFRGNSDTLSWIREVFGHRRILGAWFELSRYQLLIWARDHPDLGIKIHYEYSKLLCSLHSRLASLGACLIM